MIPDYVDPTFVDINEFAVATYTTRAGVPEMVTTQRLLPNVAVEFNTDDCIRSVLFAYVKLDYPVGAVVDYTALMEQIGYAITNDLESRQHTVQLPVPMVMNVRSVLGQPHSYYSEFNGLMLHLKPPAMYANAQATFQYLSVFANKALLHLLGDSLPKSVQRASPTHLEAQEVGGHLLVTYFPPANNAHAWVTTGLYTPEQGTDNAALHDSSSEVAPS